MEKKHQTFKLFCDLIFPAALVHHAPFRHVYQYSYSYFACISSKVLSVRPFLQGYLVSVLMLCYQCEGRLVNSSYLHAYLQCMEKTTESHKSLLNDLQVNNIYL